MQQAPVPGYTGRGSDMPGPGDYELDKKPQYSNTRAVDFSKSKSKVCSCIAHFIAFLETKIHIYSIIMVMVCIIAIKTMKSAALTKP